MKKTAQVASTGFVPDAKMCCMVRCTHPTSPDGDCALVISTIAWPQSKAK
jgi:hypothetical protein